MNSPCWIFHWKTLPSGGFSARCDSGWVLQGRNHATPAQGWAVAHDVFHHVPGDRGSYSEEVASFGAQTWFEEDILDVARLSSSLFSVMALMLENGSRGVDGLILPNPSKVELDSPHEALWRQCHAMATSELKETFPEWADDAAWARLSSPENVSHALGWMQAGYRSAQARFKERAQALGDFDALEQLAVEGVEGEVLVAEASNDRIIAWRSPGLHEAIRTGDLADIVKLLKQGEDPNVQDAHGRPAFLAFCADSHRWPITQMLHGLRIFMRCGADPSWTDAHGFTPWHSLLVRHRDTWESWVPEVLRNEQDIDRWINSSIAIDGRKLDPLRHFLPLGDGEKFDQHLSRLRSLMQEVVLQDLAIKTSKSAPQRRL